MKKFLVVFVLLSAFLPLILFAGGGAEPKAQSGPKTIEFWYAFSDAPRSGWIQDRIQEWNAQNPNFKLVGSNKGSYRETLQAAILAAKQGEAPHIVQLFEVGSQLALDSGIFMPVGKIGKFDTSDYIDSVLNYYTIDGTVNSIPFNSSSPILYINRTLAKKYGLNPDNPPLTYGQVIEQGKIAKANGMKEAVIGFNLHSWFFEQWMAEQGALLANNNNGRTARATETYLNSPAAQRIGNWIKEINDLGFYTYTGKLEDWNGSDAIFQQGNVLFHITSTADLGNISKAVTGKFELGTGFLPMADGMERNGVVIGGASVWITKGHPEAELKAALNFLLYMTNTDNMISWHKLTGYYPVRKSSVTKLEKEGWFKDFPTQTIAFKQLMETKSNYATAGALLGSFLDTRTIIEEALQKILGGAAVKQALSEAQVLADKKLQEYNSNF